MIQLWNVCKAEVYKTDFKIEKVLSVQNPHLYRTYTEIVLSTSNFSDIYALREDCSQNLWLDGDCQQTLVDVRIVSPVQEVNNRYLFTITCDWIPA